jgi:mono/diheme cytochrome c family protein
MKAARLWPAVVAAAVGGAAVAYTGSASPALQAQHTTGRTVWDGVYSRDQAERGRKAYEQSCGYCHRDNLEGGGEGPALVGSPFALRWRDHSLADVFTTIQDTMPKDDPATLTPQTYVDILSYLLQANGAPSGSAELPADLHRLAEIKYLAKPVKPSVP